VTITGPTEARPSGGQTIDFVVVPDRAQLSELVQRVRDGRLRTNIGHVAALDNAVGAFNPTERIKGKTIIRVRRAARAAPQASEAPIFNLSVPARAIPESGGMERESSTQAFQAPSYGIPVPQSPMFSRVDQLLMALQTSCTSEVRPDLFKTAGHPVG
jgi:hypothetical protein